MAEMKRLLEDILTYCTLDEAFDILGRAGWSLEDVAELWSQYH